MSDEVRNEKAIEAIVVARITRHIHDYFERGYVAERGPDDYLIRDIELSPALRRCGSWGCGGRMRTARASVSGIDFTIGVCDGRCAYISTDSAWRRQ